ncbi:MAG: hypothetical protein IJ464_06980 [Alistipes sp.]|nr:hypothetical protein [Alistipes sp.]
MRNTKRVAYYEEPQLDVVNVDVEYGLSLSNGSLESIDGVTEEIEW